LVGATTLALATSAGNKSLKPMRSSMGSAADRGSPPVYQKHGIGGEWPQREPRGELRRHGIRLAGARSAPSRNQRAA